MANNETDEELVRKWRTTQEEAAREEIVRRHVNFVYHLAIQVGRPDNKEDLASEGFIGLSVAIERFDLERGIPFHSYAYPIIKGHMLHWLRDKSRLIRIPDKPYARANPPEIIPYADHHEQTSSSIDPAQIVEAQDQLVRAMERLSEPERRGVLLYINTDAPLTQVAKTCHIRLRSLLHGISEVRQFMKG